MSTSLLDQSSRTRKRNASERRFVRLGLGAIFLSLGFLAMLLIAIAGNGYGAFTQTRIDVAMTWDAESIAKAEKSIVKTAKYNGMIAKALRGQMEAAGIDPQMKDKELLQLVSSSAGAQLRDFVTATDATQGQFDFLASSRVDGYLKGRVTRASLAEDKNLSPAHLDLVDAMRAAGMVERRFNLDFIFGGDASESRPEAAGLGVSMVGSFYMVLVVLGCALPVGVAAAIYLQEFAPKNRLTDLIEVNIANLAAVPSIVFGILGLAVFIQFAHLPQSAPLVGGLVLTLMTLPRIIIPARAALGAVPPSIREAALGVGASKSQAVFHHVLPLSMPGILTGVIIGMAQALGETAPLLLIGMVGYIASNHPDGLISGFTDPNSAMPAQIYEWAKRADPAYIERAWGGIILLLAFLMAMNFVAIVLRRKFERRW